MDGRGRRGRVGATVVRLPSSTRPTSGRDARRRGAPAPRSEGSTCRWPGDPPPDPPRRARRCSDDARHVWWHSPRLPGDHGLPPWGNEHRVLEVAGKRFGYSAAASRGRRTVGGALKAAPGVQELLVEADPDRFWVPAFLGRHGWVGVRMDLEEPDWDEVATLVRDGWRLAAPKRLLRGLADTTA
ncbi:MAG: MmcQ/YjbR family DNA-binding protein [Chloroflexota bacterium]